MKMMIKSSKEFSATVAAGFKDNTRNEFDMRVAIGTFAWPQSRLIC